MAFKTEEIEEWRDWLSNHALMGSSSLLEIERFGQWLVSINEVFSFVGRLTSLIAVFLAADGLIKQDPLLLKYQDKNAVDLPEDEDIEERLKPIYPKKDLVMFVEACMYLGIQVYAAGRSLNVNPHEKKIDSSGRPVNLSDLEQQANFFKKLHVEEGGDINIINIKSTEFRAVVNSYRHIVKNMRINSLKLRFVELVKEGKTRGSIIKEMGLLHNQFFRLLEQAQEENLLTEHEAQRIGQKQTREPRVKKEARYQVTLSPSHYKYVSALAAEKYNGNLYQAINSLLTAFLGLQQKHILDANFNQTKLPTIKSE